jgi:predicted nucleic acid-binding protein
MSLVIDASVFVASARSLEREHQNSLQFLSWIKSSQEAIHVPTLVMPECVGAMVRVTGDPEIASSIVLLLEGIPRLEFITISIELARLAADIARFCRLRGSDACYAAVAKDRQATLITWESRCSIVQHRS